ncbi:MAG: phage tail protein [Thermoanaerobaculia bacterium]
MANGNQPAAGMATGVEQDPYRGYNFRVEIEGIGEAVFTECTGLGASIQVIQYAEGRSPVVRQIPGPVRYGNATLNYGLTSSPALWEWMFSGLRGNVTRHNVSIILLDTTGTREVMRWNLQRAWISQWRAAQLDALGQDVAIESITLVFEQLERQAGGQA